MLSETTPREGLLLGIVLALLACAPVLAASLPMMGDYPPHLARWHVMLNRDESGFLSDYYNFEWKWTGNLGVDLLIYPLARLFGLEPAGRLIVAAIPVLTALSLVAAEWTLRKRVGAASLLAMAFVWSPALLLGFLNFQLSFALALFAFAGWVKLDGKTWRWAVFVPVGLVVWLCHVSGWGILGVLVFGYEWSRDKSWRAVLAPWPLLAPVLPLLFGGGTKGQFWYGPNPLLFKQAIWIKAMRDTLQGLDVATPILAGLAFLAAAVLRKLDGRLAWAALAFAALSWAIPRHVVGGDFADYRLIAVALAVGALAIDWRAPRLVLYLVPALFLARLAVTTESWQRQSAEMERELAALELLPRGAKVASAVLVHKQAWPFNPFEHIGGYAVVRRDALTNMNFALPRVHMLSLRTMGDDFTDPSQRLLQRRTEPVDLAEFAPARGMDYLWYRGEQPPDRVPAGSQVLFRSDHSLLLRLAKPPPPR